MSRVVVVGGGISGLVAARDLARAGADVTLVEPARIGGKLQTTPFDGGTLDEAADAFLARVPDAVDLCRELGLDGDLVAPAARRAYVWSHGALRLLPEGQVLGVPTDLDELAASGIVSAEGLQAVQRDLTEPMEAPVGDVAIGAFMRSRLGDEVAERLIDPLVGGINAGDTDQLSLAATVPQLDAAARSGAPSLIEACRAQRAAAGDTTSPVFFAPRGGMGALATAVASDAEAHGTTVVGDRVSSLERSGGGWHLVLGGGRALPADGVVVATPAGVTAELLRPHDARAATLLAAVPYASVAMVALAVERGAVDRDLDGTGYLIPRAEGRVTTACSWTSTKWPHLGGDGTVWLRASAGRDGDERARALDDDQLVSAVLADLADTMALRGRPQDVRVSRWHAALPQYRPGHLERVEAIEADLSTSTPGVVLTGAALRGLGVPACVRQGRAAARRVQGLLDGAS